MILAQPFDQAYKSRIDLENVRTYNSIFLIKFKGCLLNRVGENTCLLYTSDAADD